MEILIVIYLPLKDERRLRFKEKKFVIYKLFGPQFCGKTSFSDEEIAIKIYANLGLA